jgi:photosystem II stability/assembly factor-like uncharacterized protein
MNKKYFSFILFLSFLLNQSIISQSGWYWVNPLPQGNTLNKVFVVNENVFYGVGYKGTFIKTTNSGINWSVQYLNNNKHFFDLYFFNETTGFLVGGINGYPPSNVIYKTTNAGLTWAISNTNIPSIILSIKFLNVNTGYLVAGNYYTQGAINGYVQKTIDGGNTWITKLTKDTSYLTQCSFINENTGYVVGGKYNSGTIVKTTNGGENWISVSRDSLYALNCVHFINELSGITAGNLARIVKTTNGGINWNLQFGNTGYAINFLNANTGIITSQYGILLRTTNFGVNWLLDTIPTNNSFYGISTVNPNTFLIAGSSGELQKSTNYGLDWNPLFSNDYSHFSGIFFINNITGFIVGSNKVYKSTDAGQSWMNISTIPNEYLLKIKFTDLNTGYIISETKIFKSINSGLSWNNVLPSGNIYGLKDMHFINSNTGMAAGAGEIACTTNGGANWNISLIGSWIELRGIYMLNEQNAISVGYDVLPTPDHGAITKTTNGGISWSTQTYVDYDGYGCITFKNSFTGYIGWKFVTTNGGIDWNLLGNPLGASKVKFLDENVGYIFAGSAVYLTSNGGTNWRSSSLTFTESYLNDLEFINSLTGIVVGNYGVILRTTTGGNPISVNNYNYEIPVDYNLSQNYPNPFNPNTIIKFSLPEAAFATITIFDILGRELETLVKEYLQPGNYQINWQPMDLPSGIYFYTLSSNDFRQTRKSVYIK